MTGQDDAAYAATDVDMRAADGVVRAAKAGRAPASAGRSASPGGGLQGVSWAVFVGALVVALVGGFTLGAALDTSTTAATPTAGPSPASDAGHQHAAGASAGSEVGGLSVSSLGYTLTPTQTVYGSTGLQKFAYTIKGSGAQTATQFATVHDKPMHLVIARRDLSGFQHLHPTMGSDGTWSVPVQFDSAGPWRAYADFSVITAAGAQLALTLGVDLAVVGTYQPRPLPPVTRTSVADTTTVEFSGTPMVGATQPLAFRVTSAGAPAVLQPYLGSFGHLVVLREGDMGYVHVHPEPQLADGAVKIWLAVPSVGRYRMYFNYQVGGKVHTAQFTLTVP
ncbi:hypothetical protein [Catellatospora methionotrophica]|uniref:hypothetical protein n=1 Tax=Catellatospora methionotrophica TaxID=121620 RepID=UPI0033EBC96A